ncbi:MAG: sugar ABC transporter permease [Cyanobacteria bacterium P01_A01_bin.116]
MTSRLKASLTPYLFLAPALIVLVLMVFWPALQAFRLSFVEYGYDVTQPPEWVGLANFQRLIEDKTFWKTLKNTVVYLVCVVPVLAIAPLLLAILVNQKLKGISWFRVAYYTPVVVSMVVAGIAWKWLYAENGLFNQVLSSLVKTLNSLPLLGSFFSQHLPAAISIPWLTSPDWVLFSVMAVTVWKGLGYYMVIYLAGLQGLPADLYEAAAIDGSDGWRKHWDITLPLMKPYIFLVSVISAIAATKVFEEVFIMTQGGPRSASKTVVYYVYESAFSDLDMSYACTIGLALFVIILTLSFIRIALSNPADSGTQL